MRRGRAAFALLCILLGSIMLVMLSSPKELACDRKLTARPACTLTHSSLFGGRWSQFSPEVISEVRSGTRTGKGDRVTAHTVVLIDWRGGESSLAWSDEDKQREAFGTVERFFAKGSSVQSLRVRGEASPWGAVIAVGFLAIGLWIGIDACRGSGSFRIEIDLDAQLVSSRPRRFGWSGRPLVHSLEDVHDVRLVRATLHDRFKTRGQGNESAARLVLVTKHRGEIALTTGLLRSSTPRLSTLHEQKRIELLAALGLSDGITAESASEPAAGGTPGFRARWAGLSKTTRSSIVFFASIIGIAFVAQAALEFYASKTQGFLEVECSYRCRFAGAECLPGGSYRMALDPGSYTLEVYDPRRSGNWQPLVVTIVRGETVHVDCRPK